MAITIEVMRESTLFNIKQILPQFSKELEDEYRAIVTKILSEEKIPKNLHEWIIEHQLSAIKNLLKDFTIYDPKLVTYSEQKAIADNKQYEAFDIPEEMFLRINLRLAQEDKITRGILKFVEEQQQSRVFQEQANKMSHALTSSNMMRC